MQFDINRVFTALNADELKVGSRVICANDLCILRNRVKDDFSFFIYKSKNDNYILTDNGGYNFAYLVSEPKEKKLKWIDLKIGDVIKKKGDSYKIMVVGIDDADAEQRIYNGIIWLSDEELEEWEKVENE